jgi:WhiB family redox-sensing transcriptional regulator
MKEAVCGTEAGYARHRRLNETTCQACRDAHRVGCWRRRATPTKAPPPPTPVPREADFDFAALPWMSLAACRSASPDLFFAEDPRGQAAAIEVCKACPVLAECLDYAVKTNSEGIWGGLLPSQLDQVKRRRREWQYRSALRAI